MMTETDADDITPADLEQFEGKELADGFGTAGVLITANHGTDSNGNTRHKFLNPGGKTVYRRHSEVQHTIKFGSPGSLKGEGSEFQEPSDAYEGDF
jgi:hypothetical protein